MMFHFNAIALTVSNITITLIGLDWTRIGYYILNLPSSKSDELEKQFKSDEERVEAAVREWLLRDPLAS